MRLIDLFQKDAAERGYPQRREPLLAQRHHAVFEKYVSFGLKTEATVSIDTNDIIDLNLLDYDTAGRWMIYMTTWTVPDYSKLRTKAKKNREIKVIFEREEDAVMFALYGVRQKRPAMPSRRPHAA